MPVRYNLILHSMIKISRSISDFFLLPLLIAGLFTSCHCGNKKEETQQPPPTSEYDQIPLIQTLTKKIAEDGDDPDLYYERGNGYFQLGNYANALDDVTQA